VNHQLGFQLVLVHDQQVTVRTEAAVYVLRQQVHRIDVDEQHELAPLGQLPAVGAARKALVRIRVEDEPVTGREMAESPRGRLIGLLFA
jgi:hypothetical protein